MSDVTPDSRISLSDMRLPGTQTMSRGRRITTLRKGLRLIRPTLPRWRPQKKQKSPGLLPGLFCFAPGDSRSESRPPGAVVPYTE